MGPSLKAWERVRSLARIKVSAFGAGDRGFKSHRTRQHTIKKQAKLEALRGFWGYDFGLFAVYTIPFYFVTQ